MVTDNQLDQYFQFVKDMIERTSEPLNATSIKTSIQDLDKVMQLCTW